jgi:hypothetical protein
MNAINRVLVVVMLLISIPACMTLLVAPNQVLEPAVAGLNELITTLEGFSPLIRVPVGVALALTWLVVAILLLALELRRPREKMVRLDRVDGGQIEVSLKTVTDRITYDIDQLPGVLKARPRASARRRGVTVEVDVEIAGDAEVPARAAQVVEVVRRAVEERVGVKLMRPPKVIVRATPAPIAQRGLGLLRRRPKAEEESPVQVAAQDEEPRAVDGHAVVA